MTRATGLGGVLLRAADPDKLHAWYEEHLGIQRTEDGAFASFQRGSPVDGGTCLLSFGHKVFRPTEQRAMLNLRVDELDALLDKLRAAGVDMNPKREDHEYERFAWFNDPEGIRVELWETP